MSDTLLATASPSDLLAKTWSFGQEGKPPFAPYLRLLPNGRLCGYQNFNEYSWDMRGNLLAFLNQNGKPTTLFGPPEIDEGGGTRLQGCFIPNPNVRHELREVRPPHLHDAGFLPTVLRHGRAPHRAAPHARRNLVIVRANEQSLHPSWEADVADEDRSWDLCVSFYGKAENMPEANTAEFVVLQNEEFKFQALRSLFLSAPELMRYEYFMFPDDDLQMRWSDINRLFATSRHYGLKIAQPSLVPGCVINYEETKQDTRFHIRYTARVEVMCPVFCRFALEVCLPTFCLTRSAFGIDYAWTRLAEARLTEIAIIDDVAVAHTRTTGVNYDMRAAFDEGEALSAQYGRSEFFEIRIRGGIFR